jgi:hypothetical protein
MPRPRRALIWAVFSLVIAPLLVAFLIGKLNKTLGLDLPFWFIAPAPFLAAFIGGCIDKYSLLATRPLPVVDPSAGTLCISMLIGGAFWVISWFALADRLGQPDPLFLLSMQLLALPLCVIIGFLFSFCFTVPYYTALLAGSGRRLIDPTNSPNKTRRKEILLVPALVALWVCVLLVKRRMKEEFSPAPREVTQHPRPVFPPLKRK